MSREMLDMVDVLAREKNVEKSAVFGVLEIALASAVKKAQFPGEDADVRVDPNTGDWSAVRRWVIVSDDQGLQQPDREEMFSDIHDDYPELEVGDSLKSRLKTSTLPAAALPRTPSRSSCSACVTPNANRFLMSSSLAMKRWSPVRSSALTRKAPSSKSAAWKPACPRAK